MVRKATTGENLTALPGLQRILLYLGVIFAAAVPLLVSTGSTNPLLAAGLGLPLCSALLLARRSLWISAMAGAGALATLLFYGTRLGAVKSYEGLVDFADLGGNELASAVARGNLLLSAFGTAMAGALLIPIRRPSLARRIARRTVPRRVSPVFVVAVLGVLAGVLSVVFEAYVVEVQANGIFQAIWLAAATTPALLHRLSYRRLAVLAVAILMVAGFGANNRLSLLTPLIVYGVVWLYDSLCGKRATTRQIARLAFISVIVLIAIVPPFLLVTEARRGEAVGALYGRDLNARSTLASEQLMLDAFYVAVAREATMRPEGVFGRIATAPIPRFLWPEKPYSYDVEFRERHFPQLGGATPVGLAGTGYIALGGLGVVMAGLFVGRMLRWSAAIAIVAPVLGTIWAGVLLTFTLDVLRIGGLYRETVVLIVIALPLTWMGKRCVRYGTRYLDCHSSLA